MKAFSIILAVLSGIAFNTTAQSDTKINTHPLEITYNKTSTLIFRSVITSVDRGSRDILAQKAKGVENVLQLKAARESFPETNLTVITADGKLHLFTVNYSGRPATLSLVIPENQEDNSTLIFQTQMTESDLEKYSTQIANQKRSRMIRKERKYKISLSLNGIHVKDDIVFYHFKIKNRSNINYDADFMRLFIQDKARIKRTASQEVDIDPIYILGNDGTIKGNSVNNLVFALEKFTIPDAKQLVFELYEENGGRNLSLDISNKTIVNAQPIR